MYRNLRPACHVVLPVVLVYICILINNGLNSINIKEKFQPNTHAFYVSVTINSTHIRRHDIFCCLINFAPEMETY